MAARSVRFIVPWRTDNGRRGVLWDYCRTRWDDFTITTADAPGTFSRGRSINLGAKGRWDVAVICDADVVADVEQVHDAIATARRTNRLTFAFTDYAGLTPHMTQRVMEGFDGDWNKGVRYRSDTHESSIVVVPRDVWDTVKGFEPRLEGWGQDDVIFAQACRVLTGEPMRVPGTVWHLWHEQSAHRAKDLASYRDAQRLGERYRSARSADVMRALIAERDGMPVDAARTARVNAFTRIYQQNRWNGTETRSGPGSTIGATRELSDWLTKIVEKYGITAVLDAGCGEGLWQPDLPRYVGVDIVTSAIEQATVNHPDRTYAVADICTDKLPRTDAVLCRDALQHLSFDDGLAALKNFKKTKARFLIASTHVDVTNVNVASGTYYAANLEAPPFNLPHPHEMFFDGRWSTGNVFPMKAIGLWSTSSF